MVETRELGSKVNSVGQQVKVELCAWSPEVEPGLETRKPKEEPRRLETRKPKEELKGPSRSGTEKVDGATVGRA